MIGMLNNCEVTWDDKLAIKLRELDQAMKESGEAAVTRQVQEFLQEIKEKNIDIVDITEAKERLESQMRLAVDESHLRKLQQEHGSLIKDYEAIIKSKIDIFSEMIRNLKHLSDGNSQAINNEENIAEVKLATEIWDRDIYQKKRVEIDVHVDIATAHNYIDKQMDEINQRNKHIAALEKELEDARIELEDFKGDSDEKSVKIKDLNRQIQELKDEKSRLEADELRN